MKLNIGCGLAKEDDPSGDEWARVDIDPSVEPDFVVDLQQFPWPWDDASIDEVYCSHYIEHQPRELFCTFIDELYRVLAPGGTVVIVHPNLKSCRAFADPTHVDFIPLERWYYVQKQWRIDNRLDRAPYPRADFELVSSFFSSLDPMLVHRSDEAKQAAMIGRWEAAADVVVRLLRKE